MRPNTKRRAIISYEKMTPEILEAFKEKYPRGYSDYAGDLEEFPKQDGTTFYAVPLELPDTLYLVKIKVNIDKLEDVQKELFDNQDNGDGDDNDGGEGFPASDEDIQAAEQAEDGMGDD